MPRKRISPATERTLGKLTPTVAALKKARSWTNARVRMPKQGKK